MPCLLAHGLLLLFLFRFILFVFPHLKLLRHGCPFKKNRIISLKQPASKFFFINCKLPTIKQRCNFLLLENSFQTILLVVFFYLSLICRLCLCLLLLV